ncbi:FAD-dependent oxidoreductase [Flindersiella endophytica]
MKTLIIGGGIAGPVAAMALQKAGIEATVYEAYDSTADGIGAFLGFAQNGVAALEAIGADHAVTEVGYETPRMRMGSYTGKWLGEMGNGGWIVRRSDLYLRLRQEALARGIEIVHGKRLVDASQTASGVVATFADGTTATGDLLIGADGMRSRTRQLVDPNAPEPHYVGMIGTGGYTTSVDVDLPAGTQAFVFGKRAFVGYGNPGDGTTWWFGNIIRQPEPSPAELAAVSSDEWKRELRELYAGDSTPGVALVDGTEHDLITPLAMHHMEAPARWYRGRFVLIGDAAHVTSPSSGQGASLAVEDAVMLARCLRDKPTPADAFSTYQRLRAGRVHKVLENAKRTNSSKAAGPIARILRDAMMPFFIKKLADPKATEWLIGHRIDFDAPVDSELMAA